MRFRTAMVISAMIAALFAVLAPAATAAPAAEVACPVEILSANYITLHGAKPVHSPRNYVGAVQLRTDNCGNYWAYVKIYHTLGLNELARGWVSRWDNGRRTSIVECVISASGSECSTPKLRSATSASLFIASAHYYIRDPDTREWVDSHWGQTLARR